MRTDFRKLTRFLCFATLIVAIFTVDETFAWEWNEANDTASSFAGTVEIVEKIVPSNKTMENMAGKAGKWLIAPDLYLRSNEKGYSNEAILAGAVTKYAPAFVAQRGVTEIAKIGGGIVLRSAAAACASSLYAVAGCTVAVAAGVNGGVKTGHGAEQKSATVAPA